MSAVEAPLLKILSLHSLEYLPVVSNNRNEYPRSKISSLHLLHSNHGPRTRGLYALPQDANLDLFHKKKLWIW